MSDAILRRTSRRRVQEPASPGRSSQQQPARPQSWAGKTPQERLQPLGRCRCVVNPKPPSQNDCTLPPVTTQNLPAFPITFRQCWVDIFGIGARPNRKQENPLRPFDCFLGEGQLHESCDWRGKCHCRLIGLNCH